MTVLTRLLGAFGPLLLTPVLFFALAEGYVNLGGGDKDILMVLPWLLWSVVFAVSALVLWRRRWPHARALLRAGLVGAATVMVVFAVLLSVSLLGVAGR